MSQPASGPGVDLGPLKAAARRGELSPDTLAELFQVMWHTLDELAWPARRTSGYPDARKALVALEDPLMALISELEEGEEPSRPGPEDREARLDRILRARDMNATFRRLG